MGTRMLAQGGRPGDQEGRLVQESGLVECVCVMVFPGFQIRTKWLETHTDSLLGMLSALKVFAVPLRSRTWMCEKRSNTG